MIGRGHVTFLDENGHLLIGRYVRQGILRMRENGFSKIEPEVTTFVEDAMKIAASLSHVRHDSATLPPDESESSRSQKPISVSKVASIIGVDPRTVYRLIQRDAVLALAIIHRDPLRFDQELVEAYAAANPRSRGAA